MATVPPSPFLRVLSLSGQNLTVDPNEFNYLAVGESVVITYSYDVADGTTTTANTATITITGANDAPVVAAITSNKTEDDSSYSIDLLGTASTPITPIHSPFPTSPPPLFWQRFHHLHSFGCSLSLRPEPDR